MRLIVRFILCPVIQGASDRSKALQAGDDHIVGSAGAVDDQQIAVFVPAAYNANMGVLWIKHQITRLGLLPGDGGIPGRLKLIEVDDPESKSYQYRIEAQDEDAYLSGLQILENAGVSVFENTPAGRIFAALTRLNDNGQAIAVERVEELTLIPSYQRASTAVPEGGGTNAIRKEENE